MLGEDMVGFLFTVTYLHCLTVDPNCVLISTDEVLKCCMSVDILYSFNAMFFILWNKHNWFLVSIKMEV